MRADHNLTKTEMVFQVGVRLFRKSQPIGAIAGAGGGGVRYRPSLRMAAGPSGLTIPTTSGVTKSRNARTAK